MKALIHKALHSDRFTLSLGKATYKIEKLANGCRSVIVEEDGKSFEYVTQNPKTKSLFAERARGGERLTWKIPIIAGVRASNGWVLITDTDIDKEAKIML